MLIRKFNLIVCLVFILCVNLIYVQTEAKETPEYNITCEQIEKIEIFVEKMIKKAKIPGVSVVICKGNKDVFNQQYGYSDMDKKDYVTQDTYFELGSNSKALTGIGILMLVEEGKVSLNDPVSKYIPNFQMVCKQDEKSYDITIQQLLYQTSGIPYNSIGMIEPDISEDALEKTIKKLKNMKLDFIPGTKFSYATVNYDVLGFLIEKISNMTYEEYMQKEVFEKLELYNTGFLYSDKADKQKAKGYKLSYLRPNEYEEPQYRGNAPAAYISMNTKDLTKWIKLNMNNSNCENDIKKIIELSHKADRTVIPDSDTLTSYAMGWNVYQGSVGKIAHGGNNPNYSSYIIVNTEVGLGIGILANMNSEYTTIIANGIMDIIEGNELSYEYKDSYQRMDIILLIVTSICVVISFCAGILIFNIILEFSHKKRKFDFCIKRSVFCNCACLIIFGCIMYLVYLLPSVFYSELSWRFLWVWGPLSLKNTFIALLTCIIVLWIYFNIFNSFTKEKDKCYFIIILLSIISGLGNSIVIFTINNALNRKDEFCFGLLLYCLFGMLTYVIGQKIVRNRMIEITNHYIYELRTEIIDGLLKLPYIQFEMLSIGNINSILIGDINLVSNFPNIIVALVTNIGTLVFCYVYLGILDSRVLFFSTIVIIMAICIYLKVGKKNTKLWEKVRDLQDIFYDYVNDMKSGIKQLKLSQKKTNDFYSDVKINCEKLSKKNVEAAQNFTSVFVIGELVFTLVAIFITFFIPMIMYNVTSETLKTYIFVILYMSGPLSGVMNSIPELIKTKISYERIGNLKKELTTNVISNKRDIMQKVPEKIVIEVENLEFEYANKEKNNFKIGPINCNFNSGEITYIVGGNGSGKTTLLQLLTGLYTPQKGKIKVNEKIMGAEIGEYYSNVFSDFYLFKKLYGVNCYDKKDMIDEGLVKLKIDGVVSFANGELMNLNLSTGQKKRVALLLSCLEDKPIYIFDEWAADQDPEFRKLFYESFLPHLKQKGKCVIVITHDDRYFHLADKIVRMEYGLIKDVEKSEVDKYGI